MTDSAALPRVLLSSCLLHAVVVGAAYMSMPPLFDSIVRVEGWSLASLQRAWAFIPLGSGLVALGTGAWLQRRPDRSLLALSGVVAVLGIVLRGGASGIEVFVASLFLFGVGNGALLVTITSRVARAYDGERAGAAQAAFIGAYTIGAAVGLASAELLADALGGWRGVSMVWAGISAAALVPAVLASMPPSGVVRDITVDPAAQRGYRLGVTRYCAIYATYIGGYLGLVGLMPYQLRQWGWPPAQADLSMSLTTVGFLAGAFAVATWTDRNGRRPEVFATCLVIAGGLVLLTAAYSRDGSHPVAWGALGAIGFFCGAMALFFPIVMEDPHTGGERAPGVIGYATAASYVGGFVVPFVFGPMAAESPDLVVGIYAALFASAGIAMLFSRPVARAPRPQG